MILILMVVVCLKVSMNVLIVCKMSGVKVLLVCNILSVVISSALSMLSRSDLKYIMVTALFRIFLFNIMVCMLGDIGDLLKMLSVVIGLVELISVLNNMVFFNENL